MHSGLTTQLRRTRNLVSYYTLRCVHNILDYGQWETYHYKTVVLSAHSENRHGMMIIAIICCFYNEVRQNICVIKRIIGLSSLGMWFLLLISLVLRIAIYKINQTGFYLYTLLAMYQNK